jgi:hypothetical protein
MLTKCGDIKRYKKKPYIENGADKPEVRIDGQMHRHTDGTDKLKLLGAFHNHDNASENGTNEWPKHVADVFRHIRVIADSL